MTQQWTTTGTTRVTQRLRAAFVLALPPAMVGVLAATTPASAEVPWSRLPTEAALLHLAHTTALVAAVVLTATMALHLVAVVCRVRWLDRMSGILVPAVLRYAARRLVATSLAITTTMTPALADEREPVVVPVAVAPPVTLEVDQEVQEDRTPIGGPRPGIATPGLADSADGTVTRTHTVVPGDSLWSIARDDVVAAGIAPTDRTVAAHWLEIITRNEPHLRSGDPDLIYPGEVITLPSLP